MGAFYTSCRVENHDRQQSVEIPRVLVDTGSEYTWIAEKTLESIGIEREKKDLTFVMANGQQITRSSGFAILHVAGTRTTDEVIFGEEGDLQLLGAHTLEGLNMRLDMQQRKLVAAGPILAAPSVAQPSRFRVSRILQSRRLRYVNIR